MSLRSMTYAPTRPPASLSYRQLETFTGTDDECNRLIDWKAGSIAVLRSYKLDTITRGAHMQRQFTIELRVDFADPEKLGPLKQVLQQAARHAFATAQLISDNPKSTQIAIFSDDFFSGHEEIKLLDDTIQEGLDAIGEESGTEEISSELAGAFK
jgi:hypothetical protein